MSDSYIQQLFAERIGGVNYGKSTAIYKFEKIKRAKAAAKKAKPDVALIDLGVGEPDEMAFPMVVKALQTEAAKSENRGYSDNGGTDFKQAAARYMQNLFGVTVDADTEILHSIGSKAALSILPGCLINPGDYVLMTVPGYPVFGTHAKYYGGLVHNLKLTAENNFLPDLKSVPADILAKAKVLVINYPNNPTGACATLKFYAEVVAFAKQHNLVVIQDAAYGSLHFGAEQVSILQVPGAKDVALELHSLSKSHNMTGWRIGYAGGADRYEDWQSNPRPIRDTQQPFNATAPLNSHPNNPLERKNAGNFLVTGQVSGTSAVHTASDIPISAYGRGAAHFTGTMDNTDVFFRAMKAILVGADTTVAER